MWKFIARQPLVLLVGLLEIALVALYVSPLLGVDVEIADSTRGVNRLFLGLVVLAAISSWGGRSGQRERRFWLLLGGAFAVWLALELLKPTFPALLGGGPSAIFADALYLGFFLLCLLASEEVPGTPQPSGPTAAELQLIHRFAVVTFSFAVLLYFILIPSHLSPETYRSELPSYLLYAFFSLLIGARFLHRARRSTDARWRAVCALTAVSFLSWGLIDLLDAANRGGLLALEVGTLVDLFWFLPFLLMVVAFSLRRFRPASESATVSARFLGTEAGGLLWHTRAEVLVLPFLLPVVHFIGYGGGVLDEESRGVREVTLLLFVIAMAGITLLNTVLGSAARRLERNQKMAALGRLAGGVAHDFNNLLTVIRGHSELALEELTTHHPVRRSIEEIQRAGERASDLTRQLLTFSRQHDLEAGPEDLNLRVLALESMLERLLGERVRLRLELEPGLWRVRADPTQLEQVIMNLVLNARDAMPEGGQVRVLTANVETQDPWVKLAVVDTGSGIDELTMEQIFEPFFTTKDRGQGTGLGLSTVFGIVSQWGGFVRVESKIGSGSSFEVYLPRCTGGPEPVRTETVPRRASALARRTVLWVEDDPAVRVFGRAALEASGYVVLEAEDGQAALELLRREGEDVQLLITDVVMPGMSGPELAERLEVERPEIKVLFVSGYSAEEFGSRGVTPKHPLLSKPFSPELLSRTVASLLSAAAGVG